jgi:5-methylthioadenosine/S-adenosylhomocysteine deaminase
VDLGGLLTQPCFDPVSHLVHAAGREHVTHVWVNGESRVVKGVPLLQINDKELLRIASLWHTRLAN